MRFTNPHIAKFVGWLARPAALLVLAGALTGCQGIFGVQQSALVRFIDAAPDLPAPGGLDIYQNSAAFLYNIGFGSISSYIPVAPGGNTYSVDIAGTQQQLATVHGAFTLGNQFTVLVGNVAANLQITVLKDESSPAPSGQVALRFLDQATHAGAVDIYLLPANGKLAATLPTLTNVAFGNVPAYIDVASGAYSIVVLPTGTSTATTTTTTGTVTTIPTLYSGNQVNYSGAAVRTIILLDQPLSSPAGVQVITADDYDSPTATS